MAVMNDKAYMCWDYYGDHMDACMTFDGHVASILDAKSRFVHDCGVMCAKDNSIYGGGGRLNTREFEQFIDNEWHWTVELNHPNENGLRDASCITVDEGVLFLSSRSIGTYLFNTEKRSWSYVGNPNTYNPTIRYIHGNIWAFQGHHNDYNVHLIWDGNSIQEGERVYLPEKYKIMFPIVIDEDEYSHIC
ncbi:Oidioi.mRNA.OKI2018_I69.PAR.g10152.t1.cds [Oikopleura dioica]|uniref:Oidioi.mRNA.OKI2018_I69.PAR.g10152.t1.cds n=1 Tax=Oikopleura dioica TaxID=34765 RepID=A0ABN7RPC5_OIKDI|nr:Oidioi.mRNA.OKI2018_I69.PAR.g10152.t1.cds [Oikopleura dioica]